MKQRADIRLRLKYFVFMALPTIFVLIVAELASFVYYKYRYQDDFMAIDVSDSFNNVPTLFEERITPAGKVLFSRYFPTRYYVSDRNYRGKTIRVSKASNTYRIFSFGGSSTAGSPWGHEASFSRFLEDELNSIKKDHANVEVVNFGSGGYGSTRALGLVKQSMRYQPDLIIIYAGHNEIYDNWVYLNFAKEKVAPKIEHILDYSYTARVLRKWFERANQRQVPRVDLLKSNASSIPLLVKVKKGFKDEERRYLAAQFKSNLKEMIRVAETQNARVLLLSQPSNLFYEPTWYPETADEPRVQLMGKLKNSYAMSDYGSAKSYALDILKQHDTNPMAQFYLGLIFAKAGNFSAAQSALLKAIDFDERPERYVERYRDIEKSLDDPRHNVYFLDVRRRFMEHLEDGLIDGRLIMDKMHPTVEGNKLIAKTIMEDYFVKNTVRDDLFDYMRHDSNRIWEHNIDVNFYHVICERYLNLKNASECIDQLAANSKRSEGDFVQNRIDRNRWEYYFYYGLRSHAEKWIQYAKNIYAADSIRFQGH